MAASRSTPEGLIDVENTARDLVSQKLTKSGRIVPVEVQQQMAADLAERLEDAVNAAVLQAVPTHLHEEFSKAIDAGKYIDLLAKNAPDTDRRVKEAVVKFTSNYLGS